MFWGPSPTYSEVRPSVISAATRWHVRGADANEPLGSIGPQLCEHHAA